MSGTREGGLKAHAKVKARFGEEFIRERGRKGGSAKVPKGFATMDRKKLLEISRKGGKIEPVVTPKKVRSQRPKISDLKWW